MSCSLNLLVKAEHLGKSYPDLKAGNRMRYLFPFLKMPTANEFWALRDVSFELKAGRVLGIIGKNGSGKSTLMQMVAGLLEPTVGSIHVEGNVAALLELGAGFNPDFTGRENVMLSGSIYGYQPHELEEKLDRIIAFADIGKHIDYPVKTYSSGMFARLAFAVAIEVNPTLLLIDEILSVGDIGFQSRCFRRIEELKKNGTSILFVSHDLNAVQMLCDEAILLDKGYMICTGDPKEVTDTYLARLSTTDAPENSGSDYAPGPRMSFEKMVLTDDKGVEVIHPRTGEEYFIRAEFTVHVDIEEPLISIQLKTMMGFTAYDYNSRSAHTPIRPMKAGERIAVKVNIRMNICPGPFRLGMGLAEIKKDMPETIGGSESIAFEAISDKPAYGIANLEADMEVTYRGTAK